MALVVSVILVDCLYVQPQMVKLGKGRYNNVIR